MSVGKSLDGAVDLFDLICLLRYWLTGQWSCGQGGIAHIYMVRLHLSLIVSVSASANGVMRMHTGYGLMLAAWFHSQY